MYTIKLGLWNLDHPEYLPTAKRSQRLEKITAYLQAQDCDVYVLTEANAALNLNGYQTNFSDESPFRRKSRCYQAPNQYHQVAIYDRLALQKIDVDEPINGLLCRSENQDDLSVYGNVITIKDRWLANSHKTYSDRLAEQLDAIVRLPTRRCIVAGDFNLKLGWSQKQTAYKRVKAIATEHPWRWPTANQTQTVQHILHTPDLSAQITIDASVKAKQGQQTRLSDHPFVLIELEGY